MRKPITRSLRLLVCALTLFTLVACDNKPPVPKAAFGNTDITGIGYAQGFELTDHTGQKRTLTDYKGKAVVMFFGFTHCPDVCPSALAELAAVKKELGTDGEQTAALQKEFKLFVQKVPNKSGGGYSVDHTAGSYLYDPQGRIRLFIRSGQGPQTVLNDIKLILAGA